MDSIRQKLQQYVPFLEYFIHYNLSTKDKQKSEKLQKIVTSLKNDPKFLEGQQMDLDELSNNIKALYAQCRDPKIISKFKNIFEPPKIMSTIELSDSSDDEITFYACNNNKIIIKEQHKNDDAVELLSSDEEDNNEDSNIENEKIIKQNPENDFVKQPQKNYAKKSTSLFTRREQRPSVESSSSSSLSPEYNNLSSDDECERLQMFERRDNKENTITKVMEKLQFNTVPPITIDSNPIIIDSDSDNDVNEKNKSTNAKSIDDLREKNLDELQKLRCDIESALNPVCNLYEEQRVTKFDMIPLLHIPQQYNPNISIVPPPLLNVPKVNPNDPRCKNRSDVLFNPNNTLNFDQLHNRNTQFSNIMNKPIPQINDNDILKALGYNRPPVSSVPQSQHNSKVATTYGEHCRKREQEIARKKAEFEARRKKEEELVEIAKSKVPINKKIPTSESVIDKMYRKENWDTTENLPTNINNFRIPRKAASSSSNITETNNTDHNTSSEIKTKRKSSTSIETSLTEVTAVRKSTIIDNNNKTIEKGKKSIPKRRNTISEKRNSKPVTTVHTEKSIIPKSFNKNANNCIVKPTEKEKEKQNKTIPKRRKTISERRSSKVLTPTLVAEEKSILPKSCKTNNRKSSDSDSTDTTIQNPRRKRSVRRINSSDSDSDANENKSSITLSPKMIVNGKESTDISNNINVVEYIKNLNEDAKTETIQNVLKNFGDYIKTTNVVKDIKNCAETSKQKRGKRCELEMLFSDIDQMYDRDKYLSITGKRSCQTNKKRVHSDDEIQLIEKEPKKAKLIQRRKSCFVERCKISDDDLTDDNQLVEKTLKKPKLRRKSCFVDSKVSEYFDNLPLIKRKAIKPPNDEDYDTDDFSEHREQKKLQKRSVFKLPIKEVRISINRLTNEEILKYTKKSSYIINKMLPPLKAKPINKITRRQSTRKVSIYSNTNSSHHYDNKEIINSCLLCGKNSKNIVSHYVNIHDEVFISRLSKTTIDFYQKNTNYSYLVENSSTKYQVYCIFCRKNCIDTQLGFYEHYASHTGEFAYQCEKERCEVKYPYEKQMKQHCKTVHKNPRHYRQIYNYDFDEHITIKISICNICNYVQLNNANITKHLKTQHDIKTNCEDNINELILVEFKTFETNELSVEIENENILDYTHNYINNKDNINNSKECNLEHENSSDIDIGCANDELIETIVKEENDDDLDQIVNDAINKKHNNIITTINYSKSLNINNEFKQTDANEIDKKPILSELSDIFNQQNHKSSEEQDQNLSNIENIKIEIPTLHEEQHAEAEPEVSVIQPPLIVVNCESQNKVTPDSDESNVDMNENNKITEISDEPTKSDIVDFQISKIPSTVNNMFDIRIDQINSNNESEINKKTSLKPWLENKKCSSTDVSIILNNINFFNLYKCMCCSYTTNIDSEAIVHYNTHNKSSLGKYHNNKLWLECPYCENVSNSSIELVQHITTEHGYCNYQCPKCYYRSCSTFSITMHQKLLDSHKTCEQILKCSNVERSIEDEYQDIIKSRNKFVKSYSCHLCHDQQKFYISDCLKQHIRTNHKNVLYCGCNIDSIFACIFCYFENNDSNGMINHIVNSHPNKTVIACARVWNKKYKDKVSDKVESTYLVLLDKNTKSKEYIVDINTYKNKSTDNNFYQRKKLLKICSSNTNDSLIDFQKLKLPNIENTELKIHKSSKELNNEFIKLADIYIEKLRSNIGTDQLYNCTICCNSFNTLEVLKIHFKEHTLIQYYCYLCGKIELTQNLMEKHFFVHHNIQCPRIREIFKNIETNETYNAAVPSGVFCNSNDLIKHMINVLKINNKMNKNVKKSKEIIVTEQQNINNTIDYISLKNIPKYITDQKRYQCTEKNCKYIGRNENSSEGHFQQIHRRYATFQCVFCSFNINNEIRDFKIIKDHLRMHSETIYACCKCDYVYHMRQNVREHVRKYHKSEMNITKIHRTITSNNILNIKYDTCLEDGFTTLNIAYCIVCFKKMINPDNISDHLYNKHECNVHYQCRYCKIRFITQDEITNHISGDHKKVIRIRCLYDIDINLNDKEIDNNKQKKSLPIISSVISMAAAIPSVENSENIQNNNIDFDKQNSIINDNEHLKENTATSTINSSNNLNKNQDSVLHIKNSNKNIESTSNPKKVSNILSTTNKNLQSSPERNNIKSKLYKCNECGYQSRTYQNINEHVQIEHEKNKTTNNSNNAAGYHCDECGYLCEKKHDLIEHKIKLHGSSLTPYKCNDCNLKFFNVRLHQSHIRATHLQTSGFFCEKCEKFYDTNDDLLQHQKIKYGKVFAKNFNNIKCKKCDKVFDNELQLKEHENSEHFLYYCKECKFTCDTKTFLKVHCNEMHEKSINITNQSPSVLSLKEPISSVISPVQSLVQSARQKPEEQLKQKNIQLSIKQLLLSSTTSAIKSVQEATTSATDSISQLSIQSSVSLPVPPPIQSSVQPVNVITSRQEATISPCQLITQLPIQSSVPLPVPPPIQSSVQPVNVITSLQKATISPSQLIAQLPIQSSVPLPATISPSQLITKLPIQSSVPLPVQQPIQSSVQSVNQSIVQLYLQLPVQPVESTLQSSLQPLVQLSIQPSEQKSVQSSLQSVIPVKTPTTGTIRLVPIEKLVKPNLLNANTLNQIDNIGSQQQTYHLTNQSNTHSINSVYQSNIQSGNQSTSLINVSSLDMSCVMLPEFNFKYQCDLIYICNYCSYGFITMNLLLEHWRHNHETKTPFKYGIQRRVRCGYCTCTGPFSLIKQHHLETHLEQSFYIRKNTYSLTRFECVECSFITENENILIQHISNNHSTLRNQNELTNKFINEELLSDLLKIGYRTVQYKCNLCAYCCLGQNLFQDHLINVHNNNNIENESLYSKSYQNHIVYYCKECNGFFNTLKLAFIHFRENHTLPYFCFYCNESVRNYKELLIHYRSIHNSHDSYQYNCHRITDHYEIYTKKIYILFPNGLVLSLSDLENTRDGNRNNIIKLLLEIEAVELNSLSQ